ncbi:hypothetical protein L2755_12275 [Shewanella abyssi]|uniref:hypothetical protein n=1 Tax=Shewanella abyssi TaxID=311789 RepID=UPI00200C0C81|nr:hypothetical protein [Shewanella abyssi]MCL1050400.1 hypothetical protein [Shewanella abyssi]
MSSCTEKLIRQYRLKKIKQDRKQINCLHGYKKKFVEDRQELKFAFFDSKYTLLSLIIIYIYQWYDIILPAIRSVDDFGIFQWVICIKMPILVLMTLMYSASNYQNLVGLAVRKRSLSLSREKALK